MELLFESSLEIRKVEGKMYFIQVQPTFHPEPVLSPDPNSLVDAGGTSCFGTVLRDGSKFRMWYLGMIQTTFEKGQAPGYWRPMCYAESDDGIHWTKPELGLGGCKAEVDKPGQHLTQHSRRNLVPPSHLGEAKLAAWRQTTVENVAS